MLVLTMLVTSLIVFLSVFFGVWIGIKLPKNTIDEVSKQFKKKKDEGGVIRGLTPKEEKQMEDKRFRESFPQVG